MMGDGGAQDLAKVLHQGTAQEGHDLHSDDMWLAPGRAWNVGRESPVSSSFIFEPALPLGSIVTMIRGVLVLGEFCSWEVLEMLVRFTALFFIYTFCLLFLLGVSFADFNSTLSSVTFLVLAAKTQDNLSFYSAFLFQIIFLYVSIGWCFIRRFDAQPRGGHARGEALRLVVAVRACLWADRQIV
jgi:hypothetical protein